MDDDAEKRQRNRERWCQTRLRALSPLSLRVCDWGLQVALCIVGNGDKTVLDAENREKCEKSARNERKVTKVTFLFCVFNFATCFIARYAATWYPS
jgi:hypothetical protein